jgi:hypothetical protein
LGRTARVIGNIHSPRLVIEEGAVLEGSCSMLKARETQEEAEVAAATQYAEPQVSLYNSAGGELDPAFVVDEDDDDRIAEAASV